MLTYNIFLDHIMWSFIKKSLYKTQANKQQDLQREDVVLPAIVVA